MAFTSGFFNSLYSDRFYDAKQMAQLFDGLILDGVYAHVGEKFKVEAQEGDYVAVGTGRAWFNHTWSLNDSPMIMALEPANALERYDAVVLEVDHRDEVRQNSIKVVKGTAATSNPKKPTMEKSNYVFQYPLAYIHRAKNATGVVQADIQNTVGTAECPFATGILKGGDIDMVYTQLQDQFYRWWEQIKDLIEDEGIASITLMDLINKTNISVTDLRLHFLSDRNLGNVLTEEQLDTIRKGNFTDLYLGDYWEIDGVKFKIIDIDRYYKKNYKGCPYAPLSQHHLMIWGDFEDYFWKNESLSLDDPKTLTKLEPTETITYWYNKGTIGLENGHDHVQYAYDYGYELVRPIIKSIVKPYIQEKFGANNILSYPGYIPVGLTNYIWDYLDVEEVDPLIIPVNDSAMDNNLYNSVTWTESYKDGIWKPVPNGKTYEAVSVYKKIRDDINPTYVRYYDVFDGYKYGYEIANIYSPKVRSPTGFSSSSANLHVTMSVHQRFFNTLKYNAASNSIDSSTGWAFNSSGTSSSDYTHFGLGNVYFSEKMYLRDVSVTFLLG